MEHRSTKHVTGLLVVAMLYLFSALYHGTAEAEDANSKEISYLDFLKAPSDEFHGIDIPKSFIAYDLNKDNRISLLELSELTGTKIENAELPFKVADVDGDTYLTVEEFTDAPWIFEANDVVLLADYEPQRGE